MQGIAEVERIQVFMYFSAFMVNIFWAKSCMMSNFGSCCMYIYMHIYIYVYICVNGHRNAQTLFVIVLYFSKS